MRLWGWGFGALALAGLASWGGGQLAARGAAGALAQLSTEGRGAVQAVAPAGFPLAIGTRLEGLTLTDPTLGGTWAIPELTATAPLWAPLSWRAVPELPIGLTLGRSQFLLAGQEAEGGLRLGLGADLPVVGASLHMTEARLTAEGATAPSLALKALDFTATGTGARHALTLSANALTLPPRLAAQLAPGAGLPDVIESLSAEGAVTLATPAVLTAATLPPLTEIDLTQARLLWGGREITASGQLSIDARGVPTGTLTLATKDWAEWLAVAQAMGAVKREQMPMLMGLGAYLAGQSGSGAVEVPLAFAKGLMSLGPLPLGPAPRFSQRQ